MNGSLTKQIISKGKTSKEVQAIIDCSPTMVYNELKYQSKCETRRRRLAMTSDLIERVVGYSKKDHFAPAIKLKCELEEEASVETICRRLREQDLAVHSPRKVLLLTKRHHKVREGEPGLANREIFYGQMNLKSCSMVEEDLVNMSDDQLNPSLTQNTSSFSSAFVPFTIGVRSWNGLHSLHISIQSKICGAM